MIEVPMSNGFVINRLKKPDIILFFLLNYFKKMSLKRSYTFQKLYWHNKK